MISFRLLTLALASLSVCSTAAFAAPTSTTEEPFPDFRQGFGCTPLFEGTATTAEAGRISCAKGSNNTACVIGDTAGAGTRAASRLSEEKKVSAADSRNTMGSMVVYNHRGIIAGTTKGSTKAQYNALKGKAYKTADAVVIPAEDTTGGRFAKATIVVPVNIYDKQYMIQDSNLIAGKDLQGDTAFYVIVTPDGEDAVIKYIGLEGIAELKCQNIPVELLGRYLVAPGLAFINK